MSAQTEIESLCREELEWAVQDGTLKQSESEKILADIECFKKHIGHIFLDRMKNHVRSVYEACYGTIYYDLAGGIEVTDQYGVDAIIGHVCEFAQMQKAQSTYMEKLLRAARRTLREICNEEEAEDFIISMDEEVYGLVPRPSQVRGEPDGKKLYRYVYTHHHNYSSKFDPSAYMVIYAMYKRELAYKDLEWLTIQEVMDIPSFGKVRSKIMEDLMQKSGATRSDLLVSIVGGSSYQASVRVCRELKRLGYNKMRVSDIRKVARRIRLPTYKDNAEYQRVRLAAIKRKKLRMAIRFFKRKNFAILPPSGVPIDVIYSIRNGEKRRQHKSDANQKGSYRFTF